MVAIPWANFLAVTLQVSSGSPAPALPATATADSGARVRITVDKPQKHSRVGTLISLRADSVRFIPQDTNGIVAVPAASVTRLEQSRGRRSNAGRGAAIGGLAGLVLGIAASADESSFYEIGAEEVALVTVLTGATGAGIGALIGATSKSERWERVDPPGGIVARRGAILRNAMPTLRRAGGRDLSDPAGGRQALRP